MVSGRVEDGLERIVWPERFDDDFIINLVNALPFDVHTLFGLVEIFSIEYSERVPTASMYLSGAPKIYINRDWANKWVYTWTDMAAVVYHEIVHKMLYHAKEDIESLVDMKLNGNQKNLLLDIRVQGLAYQVMDNMVYQVIWKRLYGEYKYPVNLLYSGTVYNDYQIKRLHENIYSPFGISLAEVARFIFDRPDDEKKSDNELQGQDQGKGQDQDQGQDQGKGQDQDQKVIFVGSHDEDEEMRIPTEGMINHINEMREKIKSRFGEYVEQKKKDQYLRNIKMSSNNREDNMKSWSLSNSRYMLDLDKVESMYLADQIMKKRLTMIATESFELRAKKSIKAMFPSKIDLSTAPNFLDKRAISLYSRGVWPLYFNTPIDDPRGLCHIYIDNSGSQAHVIAFVVKLFSEMRRYLHNEVHFFSTIIWTTNYHKMCPGMAMETSGGTDMDVVISHAIKNRHKKCMIITDGFGSPISDVHILESKKIKQKYLIGFTEDTYGTAFDPITWRKFIIPKSEESNDQ